MNKIILDHLRRWFWVWLAVGIGYCFIEGWILARYTEFSIFTIQLLFFAGAWQLTFDFQRRHFIPLLALPLTPGQIGRGWWMASVLLPALLLAAASGLGTLLFKQDGFPLHAYLVNCLINTLCLGVFFFAIITTSGRRLSSCKAYLGLWPALYLTLAAYLIVACSRQFNGNAMPMETCTLIVVASSLTIASFLGAGYFVARRAGCIRSTDQSPAARLRRNDLHGIQGLPLLFTHTISRVLLGWALIIMAMVAGYSFSDHASSSLGDFLNATAGMTAFGTIFIIQLVPTLQLLRALRPLPLSAWSLAGMLVLLPMISFLFFGILILALTLLTNSSAGIISLLIQSCLIPMNIYVLFMPLIIRMGFNNSSMFLFSFVMLGGSCLIELFSRHWFLGHWFVLPTLGGISLVIIPASIFLTKIVLAGSSKPYLPQPAGVGNMWNWNR